MIKEINAMSLEDLNKYIEELGIKKEQVINIEFEFKGSPGPIWINYKLYYWKT